MAYTKTNWVDNQTPVNASNMNKIENELELLDNKASEVNITLEELNAKIDVIDTSLIADYSQAVVFNEDIYSGTVEQTLLNDIAKCKVLRIKDNTGNYYFLRLFNDSFLLDAHNYYLFGVGDISQSGSYNFYSAHITPLKGITIKRAKINIGGSSTSSNLYLHSLFITIEDSGGYYTSAIYKDLYSSSNKNITTLSDLYNYFGDNLVDVNGFIEINNSGGTLPISSNASFIAVRFNENSIVAKFTSGSRFTDVQFDSSFNINIQDNVKLV